MATSKKPVVTNEDIEQSLYDIYRSITNPSCPDHDALLEKIRFQLMERGHDVDSWPEPPRPR